MSEILVALLLGVSTGVCVVGLNTVVHAISDKVWEGELRCANQPDARQGMGRACSMQGPCCFALAGGCVMDTVIVGDLFGRGRVGAS